MINEQQEKKPQNNSSLRVSNLKPDDLFHQQPIQPPIQNQRYFLIPPIPQNFNYTRNLQTDDSELKMISKTYTVFGQQRFFDEKMTLQHQQITQDVKNVLKSKANAIFDIMIEIMKALSSGSAQQSKVKREKMINKTQQFFILCQKLRVFQVRQAVCKKMKQDCKAMLDQVSKINKVFSEIQKYIEQNKQKKKEPQMQNIFLNDYQEDNQNQGNQGLFQDFDI